MSRRPGVWWRWSTITLLSAFGIGLPLVLGCGSSPEDGGNATAAQGGKSDEYKEGWARGTQLASSYVSMIKKNKEAGPSYAANVEKVTGELQSVMRDLDKQRREISGIEGDDYFMGNYEGFVSVAKPYLR